MIRFFVWQIGTAGFVAVIWRYGYWREILPLAVLGSAFLWIVCGGILLSRGGKKGARLAHDSPVDAHANLANAIREMERTAGITGPTRERAVIDYMKAKAQVDEMVAEK